MTNAPLGYRRYLNRRLRLHHEQHMKYKERTAIEQYNFNPGSTND
jgi:hypothetical protein